MHPAPKKYETKSTNIKLDGDRPLYIILHESSQVSVQLALLNDAFLFSGYELSLPCQSQYSRYVITKVLPLLLSKLMS